MENDRGFVVRGLVPRRTTRHALRCSGPSSTMSSCAPAPCRDRVTRPVLERARAVASGERFFHWPLEFPEVFHEQDGRPCDRPGFDAVIGNPPWEMLRGDRGDRRPTHRG